MFSQSTATWALLKALLGSLYVLICCQACVFGLSWVGFEPLLS